MTEQLNQQGTQQNTGQSTEQILDEGATVLRVGTRASHLARTQAGHVADAISEALGVPTVLVDVTTEGDISRAPLASMGGTGVFVSALREALIAGEVDVAVHSLKDIPTAPAPGITLAAVPVREDPRDVLIARDGLTLGELPPGSTVGTGSPRRRSQLAALGLGLELRELRGNIDTRIGKVRNGELDAILLARAGLARTGRADEATDILDPLQMLPAPGQGALAVETREGDERAAAIAAAIDDPATRAAVTAERAVLAVLEAGCSAPVGALAEIAEGEDGEELWLRAVVLANDGSVAIRRSANGDPASAYDVGAQLATSMLEEGAADLMADAPPGTP